MAPTARGSLQCGFDVNHDFSVVKMESKEGLGTNMSKANKDNICLDEESKAPKFTVRPVNITESVAFVGSVSVIPTISTVINLFGQPSGVNVGVTYESGFYGLAGLAGVEEFQDCPAGNQPVTIDAFSRVKGSLGTFTTNLWSPPPRRVFTGCADVTHTELSVPGEPDFPQGN
jgi:hypothetical protein